MNWYVIYVQTGYEEIVQRYIKYKYQGEYTTLTPKRMLFEKRDGKYVSVIRKMFPGYVFIQYNMDNYSYHLINDLPKVRKILCNGLDFIHVDADEMNPILDLLDTNGIIGDSAAKMNAATTEFISGPLKGREHLICKINKHTRRAKIRLELLGETKMIDLGFKLDGML
ncbi:antiterminator LoaP [Paenibacillus sp. FSL H7-0756]|uniref:antiterminator LoaP n=1 Tax=Paenibacillus sp. FSL H7-0756 TaxID=2954738 RepID=UPI0030F8B163